MTPSESVSINNYSITELQACCEGVSSSTNNIIRVIGNTPLLSSDVISVDLGEGDGLQCYTILGEPQIVEDNFNATMNTNYGSDCSSCLAVVVCPTPTPTVTPTYTSTPTLTPSETLNSLYVQDNCCDLGENPQIYQITYLNSQSSLIPANGVWAISGQTGLSQKCYTIISPPESEYVTLAFNGVFLGVGETDNQPYQDGADPYDNCTSCGNVSGNSCKAGVTPTVTPTNTVTPSVSPTKSITPTPTKSPTRTPTQTPTQTKTPTPTPCVQSSYLHTVTACQVGATDCTKTLGYIKVNGSNVFSWGTAAITQSGNITINPGDVVELSMTAVDNVPTCVNNGIPCSDVSAVIKQGGSSGTTIFSQIKTSPECGQDGLIDYTFTATTCNYYFDLDSYCS